jgi:hypothetical protein
VEVSGKPYFNVQPGAMCNKESCSWHVIREWLWELMRGGRRVRI